MTPGQLKIKYNITEWHPMKLNYWGIPKCMNTSVKYTLYKILHPEDNQSVEGIANWVHKPTLLHYIDSRSALRNMYTNFTVIRHPYDRVVSLYKDIMFRRPESKLSDVDNETLNGLDDFLDAYIVNGSDDDNIHLRSISYFICRRKGKPLFPEVHTFDTITEFLGVDLAHINTTKKMDVVLTVGQKRIIENRYANDFDTFTF